MKVIEYLIASVNEHNTDKCLLWGRGLHSGGYGRLSYNGKPAYAHIVSYSLFTGTIEPGFKICHTCDKPACFNPRHLFKGTQKQNIHDMVSKRRHCHGERATGVKLTPEQVQLAKALYSTGLRQFEIAGRLGVSQPAISLAVNGKNWKHLAKTGGEYNSHSNHP